MTLLSVKNITKTFSNGTVTALDDVSFTVEKGDFIVIAGSNGSGKSVLMSLIAGLDEATSGSVSLSNRPDASSPSRARSKLRVPLVASTGTEATVGLVFQDADAQILGETPEEDVAFGLKNLGFKGTELSSRVDAALEKCGILHKKGMSARTLSGGEKRRLSVAGILAMERDFIIFDEPFANLDYSGVKQVVSILKELKADGKTVIVLTHEIEKILGLANRFIVLDKGKIRFDGTPDEGLKLDLEQWGIKNPLSAYNSLENLLWQ